MKLTIEVLLLGKSNNLRLLVTCMGSCNSSHWPFISVLSDFVSLLHAEREKKDDAKEFNEKESKIGQWEKLE